MSETRQSPPATATPTLPSAPPEPAPLLRIVVRPLPKVAFFWLTWVASFFCGIPPFDPGGVLGLIWMGIFFLNVLVISFDFNEERSLIFVLGGIAVILGLLYFGVLGPVSAWFLSLRPVMDRTFYWMIFGGFSVIFAFVWLNTRLNYWEFRPNEVVHRHGVFPKITRYSTEDMLWDKSVPDILERLLLSSGRIVLTTPHEKHPIVLEHVRRIDKIDDQITDILGVKAVVQKKG